jgi:serine/threonine-protein kinase
MAPEQFNPRALLTGATDRYALAMVAYKLLVGRAYWLAEAKGGNVFGLAAVAIHGPTEPASQRAAEHGVTLTPAFDAWFARATAALAEQRFPSGAEMVAALAEALGLASPRAPMASSIGSVPHVAATGSAPPAIASSPGSAAFTPVPGSTSAPSLPSVPTDIAAPATSGSTRPPAPKRGPGRAAVIAVALGALGVLCVAGIWLVRLAGDTTAEPAAGAASTSIETSPGSPASTTAPDPSASAGDTPAPSANPEGPPRVEPAGPAPTSAPESAPRPAASTSPGPTKSPKKRRYTRE